MNYKLKLGLQVLQVGEQLKWEHKPNCTVQLTTTSPTKSLEVLISEALQPEYNYITTIHLEDSKFYVQTRN